ncbi:adenylate/guanylate cyclase domain-containing protein [Nitrosospira sp. NpAV]|uniref:adenylate/guanylate cyclase domain-containing protein n=1 Tax=Nitrosospira sp. NpAV TaxID=58133 RepID=UPI000697B338|nr:adenylate/guanylate cyclase domain-containing protein [Nitrosospira sp. NpAV]
MSLREELIRKVAEFATQNWGEIPNAHTIPTDSDLTFGNDGKRMQVAILYADLRRSTEMVDSLIDTQAAEYYKAFLHCCAKVIKANSGEIQAYDGDRVMAIYTGNSQCHQAVRTAFQINYVVSQILNATFLLTRHEAHRTLRHTIGIDTGQVLVAKTGVRVDNDLVWVGGAANYAAKLNSFDGLDDNYPTRITQLVFEKLTPLFLNSNQNSIWSGPYNNLTRHSHYRSNYWLEII